MADISPIYKAAGIIIRDRRLLVERSKGKEFFIAPGGSIEAGETAKQALVRELHEEFTITAQEDDLEIFGTFEASAAGQEQRHLIMQVFWVHRYNGEPTPSSEVEEIDWINSAPKPGQKIGSIFEHQVLPQLVELGLID